MKIKINTKTIKVEGGMEFLNHDGDKLHIYYSDTLAGHTRFCWVREFNGEIKTYGSADQTKVEAERLIKKYGLIWIIEVEDEIYQQISKEEAEIRERQYETIFGLKDGILVFGNEKDCEAYMIRFPEPPTFQDELNDVVKDLIDYAEGLSSWENMIFSNVYMGLQNISTVNEVIEVSDEIPKEYDELKASSRRFMRVRYDQLKTIINRHEKSV